MLKTVALFFATAALLCGAFAEEPEIMSGSYSNPLKFDVESASTLSAELAVRGVTTLEQLNAYDAILWQKGRTLLYKYYCICLTIGCGI